MRSVLQSCIFAFILSLAGCVPPGPKQDWTAEEVYGYAMGRFEKKDYLRSIEAFRIVTLNHSTSDLVDDALFYLGESHRLSREYPVAVVTYRRLLRDFPQSPYADDAQFQLAFSIFKQSSPVALTQDKTFEAIRELQIFIDEFPESELILQARELQQQCFDKLAEKDYRIGHLYFKMNDWEAARIYFSELIKAFPSSEWARVAQYEIAESYAEEENWEKALQAFNVFAQRYPDHKLMPKVKDRIAEVRAFLARLNGDSSGSKMLESRSEKDLVRQTTDTRPAPESGSP